MFEQKFTLPLDIEEFDLVKELLVDYQDALQKEINLCEQCETRQMMEKRLAVTQHILFALAHPEPQGEYT